MIALIAERFRSNLEQVRNLVDLYQTATRSGPGRRAVQEADILRAAIVLLHATREDLLRSVARLKLPRASPEVLSAIPFVGSRRTTLALGDLASHRGMSVDAVIESCVNAFLERSNYNNLADVKTLLVSIGVPTSVVDPFDTPLAAMMSRRHLIVHRADRNESIGSGHHRASSISRPVVVEWVSTVEHFGNDLLSHV